MMTEGEEGVQTSKRVISKDSWHAHRIVSCKAFLIPTWYKYFHFYVR